MSNKKFIIETLTQELENACAYLAVGDKDLFRYHAGKADGIRDILENCFDWGEYYATEHIKAMWEIVDENW